MNYANINCTKIQSFKKYPIKLAFYAFCILPTSGTVAKVAVSKNMTPPYITEANFSNIPLPSGSRPILIASKAYGNKNRITIMFRRPCQASNVYPDKSIKILAWKNPAGEYFHFTWCQDGSPYQLETFAGEQAIVQMQSMMANNGSLIDVDGRSFTWAPFSVARRFEIEYFDLNKLKDNFFNRSVSNAPTLATQGGAPTSAAILAAHARSVAHYYHGQTTDTPGEVAYPSPFGGIAYYERRILSDLACNKTKSGAYSCSYKISKAYRAAPDSFFGQMAVIPLSARSNIPPSPFTYNYTRNAGSWVSADLDQSTYADARRAQVASAASAAANQAQDYEKRMEERERERRHRDCMNSALWRGQVDLSC